MMNYSHQGNQHQIRLGKKENFSDHDGFGHHFKQFQWHDDEQNGVIVCVEQLGLFIFAFM